MGMGSPHNGLLAKLESERLDRERIKCVPVHTYANLRYKHPLSVWRARPRCSHA